MYCRCEILLSLYITLLDLSSGMPITTVTLFIPVLPENPYFGFKF